MPRVRCDRDGAHQHFTRRELLRLPALGIGLLSLQACTGVVVPTSSTPTADALLLAPADLPDEQLREVQRPERRETRDGGQAALVIMETSSLRVVDSVVVFPSADAARAAFQTIRAAGGDVSWAEVGEAPSLGDESLAHIGTQGGQPAGQAVFRYGQVLVRLTLIGTDDPTDLEHYARKAEERVIRAFASP